MDKYDFSSLTCRIDQAEQIAVFTHTMPDGDALGSAFALRDVLRSVGKAADCFLEKELSPMYSFFPSDFKVNPVEAVKYDLKISVDCGERSRLGIFSEIFEGNTVNIDHHRQKEPFGLVNIVDEQSASTGEIIYELIGALNAELTPQIANALYAAVATDTGGFLFSNTTARTHRVAADLLDAGADFYTLNKHLLQEKSIKKYRLISHCIDCMDLLMNGKIAVTSLDYDTVIKMQVTADDLEGLSALPRSITGVEAGAILTELTPGKIKVSLRSDQLIDVSKVAAFFGGGGHVRASGFTYDGSLEDIKRQVTEKLKTELLEYLS